MICIDKNLINEELMDSKSILGLAFTCKKLSKKYLDWLFRHYYVREICENFYDSEPKFDEEEFNMYMDYQSYGKMSCLAFWNIVSNLDEIAKQKSKFKYCKEDHTIEELKNAYNKVKQMYKDYEKIRIEKLTWQEPYFEGNWGMTQRKVDSFGRYFINKIRNYPKSIKDRLYVSEGKNEIQIYFYGRDVWEKDYWFIFRRKNKNVRGEKIVYRDIEKYLNDNGIILIDQLVGKTVYLAYPSQGIKCFNIRKLEYTYKKREWHFVADCNHKLSELGENIFFTEEEARLWQIKRLNEYTA